MSVAIESRGLGRTLEGLSWLALVCGLLLCASLLSRPHVPAHVPRVVLAFGPHDLTAWADAIAGAVVALGTAANGLAILWRRWGRPPRRPRRKTGEPPEPPAGGQ